MIESCEFEVVYTVGDGPEAPVPMFSKRQVQQRLVAYLRACPDVKEGELVPIYNQMIRVIQINYCIPTKGVRQLDWWETIQEGDVCFIGRFPDDAFVHPMAVAIGLTVEEMFRRTRLMGVLQVFRPMQKRNESES